MKINEKYLSIPPFISVSWSQVAAILTKDNALVIQLKNGPIVSIPGLETMEIEEIFAYHGRYLETETPPKPSKPHPLSFLNDNTGDLPLAFKIGSNEGMISALQHNPELAHQPDLPKDALDKVQAMAKMMSPQDLQQIPQGEPHCNCFFCQICNTLHAHEHDSEKKQEVDQPIEDEVKEEDLHFEDWKITKIGDQLFSVENPLDAAEKYNVFLGDPVGCTCGQPHCEHVIAVLKS